MQVLELLEVVQFRCPYTSMKYPQLLSNLRVESKMSQELRTQLSESEKGELKGLFHHMLKWAWRYNKYLEEQTAQLHMLTSWSKIVELGHCGGNGGIWVGELQGFAGRAPSHVEPHIVTDGGGLELESKRFVWFQLSGDWARAEQQRPAKNNDQG
ncbi:nuclear pore complex protein NUP205-like isoform X2 [Triticum dicoccoides]|uniref:nuclear pore complex protein NUP205-like isoform X2 n=1 Tax=Triticum dicoccoides TaxID=85692 RepID=UPI001890A55A|nr:nuclear pore complex protein NUP205-like isoform X2 [Triticum dicoccoides]XP_037430276.1 nuclear pore complex protein NUP205-like isoform X2 [Triticum dicoccoides]XP_037430277.1 nuclear pore complex protein NUP205-like isoform X2 [Triticum dicoccoides]